MSEIEATTIRICKRDYKIASDEWQPLYIKKLGEILNNEIKQVESETKIADNYKLLIIGALKIIDKLLRVSERKTGSSQLVEEEIENLNTRIKKVL